ncbi:iron-sulfur cluster repair di-iron protein [Lutispora thermophila]|uniref:Regulator of cell morphogenesis and NO signaling n=1 Tax=Lutispora thermophila DSM 19022 TaxID=1122184 RepID=A0A1M6FHF1_9FIRM|nr:iron-sulfur cluster repair di-iron protein [Lutispora thermophila]SHI97168.1 regulator of cell morphogenesis and NO signaling [Lutispora thermophila DSM 19022]
MGKFNVNDRVGDIVAMYSAAADIFMDYNIDFCCGGNKPLNIAAQESNVEAEKILNEINSRYEDFAQQKQEYEDYAKYSSIGLMDHIVNTHHKFLWEEMPTLSKLTQRILAAHGDRHPELSKVKNLYEDLRNELEDHLKKEEDVIFPLIKAFEEEKEEREKDDVLECIRSLRGEHEAAGNILKELKKTTHDYVVPDDACRTFDLTYTKLQEMERDIFLHIHLENNILFKRYEG